MDYYCIMQHSDFIASRKRKTLKTILFFVSLKLLHCFIQFFLQFFSSLKVYGFNKLQNLQLKPTSNVKRNMSLCHHRYLNTFNLCSKSVAKQYCWTLHLIHKSSGLSANWIRCVGTLDRASKLLIIYSETVYFVHDLLIIMLNNLNLKRRKFRCLRNMINDCIKAAWRSRSLNKTSVYIAEPFSRDVHLQTTKWKFFCKS